MFSKGLKNLKSELIDFTPPKRHDGKNSYIDFQMRDPATGRLKRKSTCSTDTSLARSVISWLCR